MGITPVELRAEPMRNILRIFMLRFIVRASQTDLQMYRVSKLRAMTILKALRVVAPTILA